MMIDNLLLYQQQPLKYRLTLLKPTYEVVSILNEAFEIKYTGSLSDINQLSFLLPYYIDEKVNDNFSRVQCGYLIYCELINEQFNMVYLEEYFLINNIENIGDDKETKSVDCLGLAFELSQKLLKNFKGSKKLFRTNEELATWTPSSEYPTLESFKQSGILNTVFRLASSWKIGSIDEEVNEVFRDFEVDGVSVLDFLINTVQISYGVIFLINSIEKTISIRKLDHLGTFKGFFVSNNSYMKSITETINQEEVVTKLYIYGRNGVSIQDINIKGEEYLVDFSYYRNSNFMSDSLLNALDNYDALVASRESEFENLRADLSNYNNQLSTQNDELDNLNEELKDLEKIKDGLITDEDDLSDINSQINAKNVEISNKESEIAITQGNIDNTTEDIKSLQLSLLIENNLSETEIIELDPYIKEKEIHNESINDAQELYNEGLKTIRRISEPCVQFDVELVDIYSYLEGQLNWDKINLGDIAFLHYDKFDIDIELRILSFVHDYENNRLTLTFANKKNIHDPNFLIEELKSAISTNTVINNNKYKLFDYPNNDKPKLLAYIENELDLALQGAVAGNNQSVKINDKGITLTNPADSNKQIRLMNNCVVLTDDGWQTAKTAVLPSGIIAERLIGKIILGTQLLIENSDSTFVINDNVLKVIDDNSIDRVQLGRYDTVNGKYGLLLKDPTGNRTVLDESGILQTWQDSIIDNVDSTHPLKLNIYIPSETKSIYKCLLRFNLEAFRAYSTGASSGGGTNTTSGASSSNTTESGGEDTKTSGASSLSTTSSGGGTTTGASGSHRHLVAYYLSGTPSSSVTERRYRMVNNSGSGIDLNLHADTYSGTTSLWTYGEEQTHTHSVSSHSHGMAHTHTVDIPLHTHGMAHTHSVEISPHTHGITYGIYESTVANNITVKINGTDRTFALGGGTGFTSDQSGVDISDYMNIGQNNIIELGSSQLGRISSSFFIEALLSM